MTTLWEDLINRLEYAKRLGQPEGSMGSRLLPAIAQGPLNPFAGMDAVTKDTPMEGMLSRGLQAHLNPAAPILPMLNGEVQKPFVDPTKPKPAAAPPKAPVLPTTQEQRSSQSPKDQRIEQLIANGMPPSQARLEAGAQFDDITNVIIDQFENNSQGITDSNGARVQFGINSKYHPEAAKNITRDTARAIYKRDYWDKIGADQLPASIRGQAYDAAIVQGPELAQRWAAESGGDPRKFAALRLQHMENLANSSEQYRKYLPGWRNRVNQLYSMETQTGLATPYRSSDPSRVSPQRYMTPGEAMGFIPDAMQLGSRQLPPAPHAELPTAQPHQEQFNIPEMLKWLEPGRPQGRDKSGDKRDKMLGVLAAMGQQLAGAGNYGSSAILALGTGAVGGTYDQRQRIKALDERDREMLRQFELLRGQEGLGESKFNVGVRNVNADRDWTSTEAVRTTKDANNVRDFNRNVQQTGMDQGVDQYNVGNINEVSQARGRVGLAAADAGIATENKAQAVQDQNDFAQLTDPTLREAAVRRMQQDYGIGPSGKDTLQDQARHQMVESKMAGNQGGMVEGLAKEMVSGGGLVRLLSETPKTEQGKTELAALKQQIMQANQTDKSGMAASGVLAQYIRDHPSVSMKTWAENYAPAVGQLF